MYFTSVFFFNSNCIWYYSLCYDVLHIIKNWNNFLVICIYIHFHLFVFQCIIFASNGLYFAFCLSVIERMHFLQTLVFLSNEDETLNNYLCLSFSLSFSLYFYITFHSQMINSFLFKFCLASSICIKMFGIVNILRFPSEFLLPISFTLMYVFSMTINA